MNNKIPSSAKEITDREDLRVGDIATFTYRDHEFTGEVWRRNGDSLIVGSATARYGDGVWSKHLTFVRAFRPAPALPTEPGAVILVTECRGTRVGKPVVAWWDDVEGSWTTPAHRFGGMTTHDARDITEWTTATVVSLEESA